MSRQWYKEPETFIAFAALVVSLSAVAIGLYEASLQRKHDRAEVWPRVELSTFTEQTGAKVWLSSSGIGPAIVKSVALTVDDKPQRNWNEAVRTLLSHAPAAISYQTVADRVVRAGDRVNMIELGKADMGKDFWTWIKRVTVRVCYSSVFDESWMVTGHLGVNNKWEAVEKCPAQEEGVDF